MVGGNIADRGQMAHPASQVVRLCAKGFRDLRLNPSRAVADARAGVEVPVEHRERAKQHALRRCPNRQLSVLIHVMNHAGHALAVGPVPLSLEVRDGLLEPGGTPVVFDIEISVGAAQMGEVVGELGPQLNLDGCYRAPEPRAKSTIELVDLSNVIETRTLDEGTVPLEREPVAAEPIVVQVA